MRLELRKPPPLYRPVELKKGAPQHREPRLLPLLQRERRQERVLPSPFGIGCGANFQAAVRLVAPPFLYLEQHLLLRGQRP